MRYMLLSFFFLWLLYFLFFLFFWSHVEAVVYRLLPVLLTNGYGLFCLFLSELLWF